mgnify:CR=1 FL=1
MKWEPIETVPKDGTSILVCVGSWMTVAAWNKHQCCLVTNGPRYDRYAADEQPEYWMPLPERPQ